MSTLISTGAKKTRMGYIVALAQVKGGVGKSTIAANLAVALKWMDPQKTVVVAEADDLGQISLLLEHDSDSGVRVVCLEPKAFRSQVEGIEADIAILDLPTSPNEVIAAGVLCANLVLIPVTPCKLDIAAAVVTAEALKILDPRRRPPFMFLQNRLDARMVVSRDLEAVLLRFGPVLATALSQRSTYVNAATEGLAVRTCFRNSEADFELRLLATEVHAILQRTKPSISAGPHTRSY